MNMEHAGFSVMELLVVVALIAVLSAIALISLRDPQQRAQDSQRLSHMHEVTKALELYFTNHARYPILTATTTLTGSDPLAEELAAEGAAARTPIDPRYPTFSYTYQSNQDGTDYTLRFCLETNIVSSKHQQGCDNYLSP